MRWNDPIGYLITITGYGTWLHGDERGSMDRKHGFVAPDFKLEEHRRSHLNHDPMKFDANMRKVIREAIEADCLYRQRHIEAINVRTNHVHVVVLTSEDPSLVVKNIKAWATRQLRKEGLVAADRPVWTEGGSKRWLWNRDDVRAACMYVMDCQGDDLPEVPVDSEPRT
ncbi:MAG: transposase [Planctomycetota bacterium]|nr:transposase [Planctomycetota bacterium]